MVATAFLSGLFGMAGGMILIGVLLMLMPLPTAMVLHAITQMASNGWRAFLWRAHIRWRPVFVYLIGCALALGAWSITRYVPDKPIALLLLGVTPFMARLMPKNLKPNPDSICAGLVLRLHLHGADADDRRLRPADGHVLSRRQFRPPRGGRDQGHLPGREPSHKADLFRRHHRPGGDARSGAGGVAIAASMLGTTLARRILEAMSDAQFRTWANRLITTVAGYYILYGGWLLFTRTSAMAF